MIETVWICKIEDRSYGEEITVHSTADKATEVAYAHVAELWHSEDGEIPTDKDAAIERFNELGRLGAHRFATVEEYTVDAEDGE